MLVFILIRAAVKIRFLFGYKNYIVSIMLKFINYREHTIAAELIEPSGVVLDCGSHRGEYAKWVSEQFGVSVIGFEANDELYGNLPVLERVDFRFCAIGGENGITDFSKLEDVDGSIVYYENMENCSRVKVVGLGDFLKHQTSSAIELIKIDIEGAELDAIESIDDECLKRIKQMTVEFHDFINPDDVPRIKRILSRLKASGFYVFKMTFFTYGDIVLLNSKYIRINLFDQLVIQIRYVVMRGIIRFIKRKFLR